MIYLASPYTSPDPDVQAARFRGVCLIAAELMSQGHNVFSPIAHTHPIGQAGDLPGTWDFWKRYDEEMIGFCSCVLVCDTMYGAEQSRGIKAEIEIAESLGKPVLYLSDVLFGKVKL